MPVSFGQAQASAINSGFLSNLGASKSEFGGLDITNTTNMLAEIAGEFVQDATDNLNKDDKNSTGHLTDSIISLPLRILGTKVIADVKVADYYDFVNKGVRGTQGGGNSPYSFKGKMPPVELIKQWVIREGIRAKNVKKGITRRERAGKKISKQLGNDKTISSISFAIARSIKKKGLKGDHFWDNALKDLKSNLKEKIAGAFKVDVITSIKKDFG